MAEGERDGQRNSLWVKSLELVISTSSFESLKYSLCSSGHLVAHS